MFPKGFRRSPALPILVILLVVGLPVLAWRLHRLGRFSMLKREITKEPQGAAVVGPRPGGAEPIVLSHEQTPGAKTPEFRTVTLLPGLGMDVLQITAFVPNLGEIELLANPSVKDVADGTAPNRSGVNDTWGALEAPWSGLLSGVLTPLGNTLRTSWRGHAIEAPVEIAGRGMSDGGLLAGLGADTTALSPQPKPTTATATFKGTEFDEHWISRNDVQVTVTLGAKTIDIAISVKNVGDQPEPMGLGWHPRFVIPSGNRNGAEVHLPAGELLEIADLAKGIPSGRFGAPGAAIARFQVRPWPIGAEPVDGALAHLKAGADGVSAELRDPQSDFGLRMTGLSSSIRELRVTSPSGSNYVSLGTQTNYDDPLGKEWGAGDNAAIQVLLPGQTEEWKTRLEIFPVANHGGSAR
jgi:hypothetical protein